MKKIQSWNINFIFILKYSKLKCQFLQSIIILCIEILIFGCENINVEFKYQILDQINLFKFKLKISCSNPKSKIQIMFWTIEITIFRFE